MGFPTVVTRSRGARRRGIPFEHGKFGRVALDHKPVTGAAGNPTADFASEFLKRGHSFCILPFCPLERCSLASLIIQMPAALFNREISRKGAFPHRRSARQKPDFSGHGPGRFTGNPKSACMAPSGCLYTLAAQNCACESSVLTPKR